MFKLVRKKKFVKAAKKLCKNRSIFNKFSLVLFRLQEGPPFEKHYNVHLLRGTYSNFYSINVTGDIRIIFSVNKGDKEIVLHFLGTHSELYG